MVYRPGRGMVRLLPDDGNKNRRSKIFRLRPIFILVPFVVAGLVRLVVDLSQSSAPDSRLRSFFTIAIIVAALVFILAALWVIPAMLRLRVAKKANIGSVAFVARQDPETARQLRQWARLKNEQPIRVAYWTPVILASSHLIFSGGLFKQGSIGKIESHSVRSVEIGSRESFNHSDDSVLLITLEHLGKSVELTLHPCRPFRVPILAFRGQDLEGLLERVRGWVGSASTE